MVTEIIFILSVLILFDSQRLRNLRHYLIGFAHIPKLHVNYQLFLPGKRASVHESHGVIARNRGGGCHVHFPHQRHRPLPCPEKDFPFPADRTGIQNFLFRSLLL